MKVLVVGSGGREHAIVRALRRADSVSELLCAPGNPGIASDARLLDIPAADCDRIAAIARQEDIDLVVVGPEVPLVAGIADVLEGVGVPCFGPTAAAARLEGSKAFAKEIMRAAGVPTATSSTVTTVTEGMDAIGNYPVVIKADGLAAGKGVVIAQSESEAEDALNQLLVERKFDTERVLIEEFLSGDELSLLALCDGEHAYPLAPAQDFKRIGDGDQGPNTGGMGAYSPVPGIDEELIAQICAQVHQPVVDQLRERGTPFHGVLYAGLMLAADDFNVLEFNVRFGDPETQAVLPRLQSDLGELMLAATGPGGLAGHALSWSPQSAVTIVLASEGYPDSPRAGDVITGLKEIPDEIELTHAGTAESGDQIVTAGGRVLNVTALAADLAAAREAAYTASERIDFRGKQLRTDIALKAGAGVAS